MLYIGESVGRSMPGQPEIDIAVDPLEGTNLVAHGNANAITVIAASEKGGLFNAPDTYLDKLCVGPDVAGKVDTRLSPAENLLLPWTRETVWMPEEPKRIQEHTRPLIRALGSDVALDRTRVRSPPRPRPRPSGTTTPAPPRGSGPAHTRGRGRAGRPAPCRCRPSQPGRGRRPGARRGRRMPSEGP
jgi:hypothetical protein